MKRFAIGFVCALSLALVPACGGDDDDNGDGQTVDSGGGGTSAAAFCAQYGTVCMFDGDAADTARHDDQASCEAAYNGYTATRQVCVVDHVGLADAEEPGSADEAMHCDHATGNSPCI